ncbi:hypothetical protein EV679_2866 [Kerstersia gyiorum]|uniref:Uncharacterized protein n=2 Tax=Kerstersia gyiorum TaxID=206506 RepID=A0A4Q7MJH9_9BURK|nr:hypothetical protein EV679_2866 [Kerstersia gyiorum]
MPHLANAFMAQVGNESIWNALEAVRLRQTPWHKKQAIFDRLQALGLIEATYQKTSAQSPFPAPRIAVLTENGRQALSQYKRPNRTA